MLAHLLSAEMWKSIETTCKILAFSLAGMGALNGAVAYLANTNAAILAKEPRRASLGKSSNLKPFSIVFISIGLEAKQYADELIATLPQGSEASRFVIGDFYIGPAPRVGLSYNPKDGDTTAFMAWARSESLTLSETDGFDPAFRTDRVVFFIGAKLPAP